MTARLYVIGAGVAGLAAALAGARRGVEVHLSDAAPQAGGRCRTVAGDFAHDNGTHVLLSANLRALAFLDAVGARERWIEPEPDGLPVYDAATHRLARVGLSPWSWRDPARRPPGLALADLPRLLRLALPLPDRTVASLFAGRPIYRSLIEPLTVAVLNTPGEVASARRLAPALRRIAMPGAARLLVAREGLSADLIGPAVAALQRQGGTFRAGTRLRAVEDEDGRATVLRFADGAVRLGPEDGVVLALPPAEVGRLLPGLRVPDAYEPILNLHYQVALATTPRFVGLTGTLAQWVLVRGDHVSVTVSAAGDQAEEAAGSLATRIWQEVAPALAALGLDPPAALPPHRVVREKRATLRQGLERVPLPPLRPLANLRLAGDWLTALPATIESAVMSGEAAAASLSRRTRSRPARLLPGRVSAGVG
ncbi:MAG TPA: FAD-dependent oxidoreductase [Beijerinckiaceae bacterium]